MTPLVWNSRHVWQAARILALVCSLPVLAAGCRPAPPPAPTPEPERQTLSIVTEVPSQYRERLSRAGIIAHLTSPLHALAARDKRAAFDLDHNDEGPRRTDYEVDLVIKAADPRSYQIEYRVAVGEREETGIIQRDAEHIRRIGATLPYPPDGVLAVAVGRDLEVVGSRLALLIQDELSAAK